MTTPDMAIVGSYPPPFGGVANHVVRLMPLLEQWSIQYTIYNAVSNSDAPPRVVSVSNRRRAWIVRFLLTCKENSVFLLTDRLSVWVLAASVLRLRRKKIGVRLRNSVVLDISKKGGVQSYILKWAMRRMHLVVCVSKELTDKVLAMGLTSERVVHAPGFLPPSAKCLDSRSVAKNVMDFCSSGGPLIVANGKIKEYKGCDLYGLDMIVELAGRLAADFPEIRVVVCFWDFSEREAPRLNELYAIAEKLGVRNSIIFNTNPGVFLPVLAKADVFVRPTATDGDANSVRESLALGVPAVASDVVERPTGCVTHANRNVDDLEAKVREVIPKSKADLDQRQIVFDPDLKLTLDGYLTALSKLAS